MEYSRVAAAVVKDEEEISKATAEIEKSSRSSSVSYHYLYPCDLLEEAVRALFKCFGLAIDKNKSNATQEQDPAAENTSTPSTPEVLQSADPSSDPTEAADDDPPSSTSETNDIAAASARVVRPQISTGRGPQIN